MAAFPAIGMSTRHSRSWLVAPVLALLVLVGLSVVARGAIGNSLTVVGHGNWTWMAVTGVLEIASMIAFARAQRVILLAAGGHIPIPSMAATATVGNAISFSLPIVGAGAGTAFTYRRFVRFGSEPVSATWALGTAWLLSSVVWSLMLILGAILSNDPAAAIAGIVAGAIVVVASPIVFIVMRQPKLRRVAVALAARLMTPLRGIGGGHDGTPAEVVDRAVGRFFSIRMTGGNWIQASGLTLLNWTTGAATLVTAILAVGAPVPWSKVLLVYCAGATASSFNITPGGLGVVEAALTAALIGAGMPSKEALATVLIFRAATFWIPVVAGWSIYALIHGNASSPSPDASLRLHDPLKGGEPGDCHTNQIQAGAPARHHAFEGTPTHGLGMVGRLVGNGSGVTVDVRG
jgi:uncharacterized membrane protein YbhN (UPF0104 family)